MCMKRSSRCCCDWCALLCKHPGPCPAVATGWLLLTSSTNSRAARYGLLAFLKELQSNTFADIVRYHIPHGEVRSQNRARWIVSGTQAIDLQPEEPRAGLRASDTTSLRGRLSRFNAAVLRVVAADAAGLPDSEQVLALLYELRSFAQLLSILTLPCPSAVSLLPPAWTLS